MGPAYRNGDIPGMTFMSVLCLRLHIIGVDSTFRTIFHRIDLRGLPLRATYHTTKLLRAPLREQDPSLPLRGPVFNHEKLCCRGWRTLLVLSRKGLDVRSKHYIVHYYGTTVLLRVRTTMR